MLSSGFQRLWSSDYSVLYTKIRLPYYETIFHAVLQTSDRRRWIGRLAWASLRSPHLPFFHCAKVLCWISYVPSIFVSSNVVAIAYGCFSINRLFADIGCHFFYLRTIFTPIRDIIFIFICNAVCLFFVNKKQDNDSCAVQVFEYQRNVLALCRCI